MSHPDWLTRLLIQFNRNTTCLNEWELLDIVVDLHRQPDLPRRLDVLFESLQEGLGKDVLVAGNFMTLGYFDGNEQVFPRFIELGKQAPIMEERREDEDDEAASFAYTHAVNSMNNARKEGDRVRVLVIQLPYFIKRIQRSGDDDLCFPEFQRMFANREILFTDAQFISAPGQVTDWIGNHRADRYAQRFVLTLGLFVQNGIEDKLRRPEIQDSLAHLLGAFLTWAGMGVADSTRYVMAGVAAKLAHFSHEFLKPYADIRKFLDEHGANLPGDLRNRIEALLKQVNVPRIREMIASGATAGKAFRPGGMTKSYSFRQELTRALSRNTNHPENVDLPEGAYPNRLMLTLDDERNTEIRLEVQGLPASGILIDFDASYLNRLIRNLLRNTAQHTMVRNGAPKIVDVQLSFKVDERYNFLTMYFTHRNSRIAGKIRRLLFRMPVPSDKGGGIGLWTIGMAFESERLPLPCVDQIGADIRFTFQFPTIVVTR